AVRPLVSGSRRGAVPPSCLRLPPLPPSPLRPRPPLLPRSPPRHHHRRLSRHRLPRLPSLSTTAARRPCFPPVHRDLLTAQHLVSLSNRDRTRCELFDLHQQIVPLVDSWGWQKSIVERRKPLVGIDTDTDEDHSDTLIALQHPPVYTLGNGSSEKYLNFNIEDSPIESHRIDRAGEVTYHGPGQLVLYPILNLRYQKKDLNWYQRSLETVVNRALQSAFSIKASTIEGLTGVWVGDQKVAAIGTMCARWIVYHGLALNVTTDLTPFEHIVPCGIKGRGVGSIKQILQKASNGREYNDAELMDIAYDSLIKEFADFFQLSLEPSPDLYL
uniref:lipoyl(octanoyl) transferase n=1 Tax=Aegilops tauschii subsp. strangulata TaxID=200361 RepID=A0A453E9B7_AEGTS